MRQTSIPLRFLAVLLSLTLGLPNSAGASPELSRRTLRQSGLEENAAKLDFLKALGWPATSAGLEELLKELQAALRNPDPKVRSKAVGELPERLKRTEPLMVGGDARLAPFVAPLMGVVIHEGEDPETREKAAEQLGDVIRRREALEPIAEALGFPDPSQRVSDASLRETLLASLVLLRLDTVEEMDRVISVVRRMEEPEQEPEEWVRESAGRIQSDVSPLFELAARLWSVPPEAAVQGPQKAAEFLLHTQKLLSMGDVQIERGLRSLGYSAATRDDIRQWMQGAPMPDQEKVVNLLGVLIRREALKKLEEVLSAGSVSGTVLRLNYEWILWRALRSETDVGQRMHLMQVTVDWITQDEEMGLNREPEKGFLRGLFESLRKDFSEQSPRFQGFLSASLKRLAPASPTAAGAEELKKTVELPPGRMPAEEELLQWERETFLPHVQQLIREHVQGFPPDRRVLWDVGALTGEVSEALLPLFSQGRDDRVIAFEMPGSRALPVLRRKRGPHFEVVEGDFLKQEVQRPTVVLASHVLGDFPDPRQRREMIDGMLDALPPGRPLIVILNDVRPRESTREGMRRALLPGGWRPVSPEGVAKLLKERGLDVRTRRVRLEIRGDLEQIARTASWFLGDAGLAGTQDLQAYLEANARVEGQPDAYAFTANQVIVMATKPMPAAAVRLPIRMRQFLPHLAQGEQEQLFSILTDAALQQNEERGVERFLGVIQRSGAYRRLDPDAQRALEAEIVRQGPFPAFVDREAILNLLRVQVGRGVVGGLVSVDTPIRPSGLPLSEILLEVRGFSRLLAPEERQALDPLFQSIYLEGADLIPEDEFGRADTLLRRVFGTPRDPRAFSVAELIRAYPEVEEFLLQGLLPEAIRREVAGGGRLRIVEANEILGRYRARPESQRLLPASLGIYRDALQSSPVSRLLPQLPPLEDPVSLWDPFQMELLQDFARVRRNIALAETGEPAPPAPPWPLDAGAAGGLADFPREIRQPLAEAQSFTRRVILLAESMGMSDRQLCALAGVGEEVVRDWKRSGTREPRAGNIPAFAAAVQAHPLFLLTALSKEEALRRDPQGRPITRVSDRAKLLMKAKGYTWLEMAAALGESPNNVKHLLAKGSWTRPTVRKWATTLGESPVLLETGWQPSHSLFSSVERVGFVAGAPSRGVAALAPELEGALVERWRQLRGDATASAWAAQIASDESYSYPGLAVRLLTAYPGTIQRMAHYGLIPPRAADRLLKWRQKVLGKKSPSSRGLRRIAKTLAGTLAEPLAEAREGLDALFQTALQLDPGAKGYPDSSKRNIRVRNGWDFIARGICQGQILALADRTDAPWSLFKAKILFNPAPEALLTVNEARIAALTEEYPLFPDTMIRNYVLALGSPRAALDEAQILYDRLVEMSGRGWIRPVRPDGSPLLPPGFARWILGRATGRGRALLDHLTQRSASLREALSRHPSAAVLRQMAVDLPGVSGYVEEDTPAAETISPDLLAGLDLLHRLVAYRQVSDPAFFREPTAQQAAALVEQVAALLQEAQASRQLPQSPQALEVWLQNAAKPDSLKALGRPPSSAGLEEIRYESLTGQRLEALLALRKRVGMTGPAVPEMLRRFLAGQQTAEGVLEKPEEGGIVAVETAISPEGRLIGYGAAEIFSWVPFEAEIKEFGVEPEQQGRGIGKELFGRLLNKVQKIPRLASIYVTDLSGTGRAVAIARGFGFQEAKPIGFALNAYPQYVLELNSAAGAEEIVFGTTNLRLEELLSILEEHVPESFDLHEDPEGISIGGATNVPSGSVQAAGAMLLQALGRYRNSLGLLRFDITLYRNVPGIPAGRVYAKIVVHPLLDSPPAAGLEEQQAVWGRLQEHVDGFRSVSPPDSKAVVVIGKELAQKFVGLQVYAAIWNRRVVIDRGDLYDTLIQAAQRGDAVHFYGDSERGRLLESLADRAGLPLSFFLRDPAEYPSSRLLVGQILKDIGVPSEVISAGLEGFTRDLEQLGVAA